MKYLITLLIFLCALLTFEAYANAPEIDDIILSWETPTAYENGAVLEPEDIEGYKIYYTLNGAQQPTINIGSGTNSYVIIDADFGTYEFRISTTARSLEGQPSDMLKVIHHLPNAPIFRVIIERCDSDGTNCTQEVIQ